MYSSNPPVSFLLGSSVWVPKSTVDLLFALGPMWNLLL